MKNNVDSINSIDSVDISDLIGHISLKLSNNIDNIMENVCKSKIHILKDFIESYGVDFEMFMLTYGDISPIKEDIKVMGYRYKIIDEDKKTFLLVWNIDNPRDCYSYCFFEPKELEE